VLTPTIRVDMKLSEFVRIHVPHNEVMWDYKLVKSFCGYKITDHGEYFTIGPPNGRATELSSGLAAVSLPLDGSAPPKAGQE
jgi:hypothetical protein